MVHNRDRVITKNLYIFVISLLFFSLGKTQVVVEGKMSINGNTVLVIEDQDVIVNGEIEGKGVVQVKPTDDKEVKVVYKGKVLKKSEDLAAHHINIENQEDIDNERFIVEKERPRPILVKEEKNIVPPRVGTLILVKEKAQIDNPLPIATILLKEIFQQNIENQDNYFILNGNYIIITKEPIMSSQNMHDTLYVKAILDPPKKYI